MSDWIRSVRIPGLSKVGPTDLVHDPLVPRLSIADEIFARPELPKVFISSRMRGGVLAGERLAVAREIESTRMARAWYWERDAHGGPFSSFNVCVGHAASSDALFLILTDDLTRTTRAEYLAAKRNGAFCCILVLDGAKLSKAAKRFLDTESKEVTYCPFRNESELRSQVVDSFRGGLTYGLRLGNIKRRLERSRRGSR